MLPQTYWGIKWDNACEAFGTVPGAWKELNRFRHRWQTWWWWRWQLEGQLSFFGFPLWLIYLTPPAQAESSKYWRQMLLTLSADQGKPQPQKVCSRSPSWKVAEPDTSLGAPDDTVCLFCLLCFLLWYMNTGSSLCALMHQGTFCVPSNSTPFILCKRHRSDGEAFEGASVQCLCSFKPQGPIW